MGINVIRSRQSLKTYMALKEDRQVLSHTVETLKSDISQLQEEIHKLKVSPEYALKVLRDKYHVTEKNEEIIFFTN